MFHVDRCTACGTCLSECPYLSCTTEEAGAQIRALVAGQNAAVLEQCITCMACNELCPEGTNPYDLILAQQETQRIRMIPPAAVDMIEHTLADQPTRVTPGDRDRPALCVCTMEQAYPPGMLESSLLQGMTVAAGGDFFSRVVYLHTGMESVVREHASAFIARLTALGHDEVVFVHEDCYVLAAHKAAEYGIEVPFRPVFITDYLLRALRQRRGDIIPLGHKIAWQRPCIDRYAPEIDAQVDSLCALIGVERVARRYDRLQALCCGLGLRSSDTERKQVLARMNLTDARTYDADAVVFVCPGCYVALGAACAAYDLKAIFLTDLCRMAIGELPWSSRPLSPPRVAG